jgi:hypothetical protein
MPGHHGVDLLPLPPAYSMVTFTNIVRVSSMRARPLVSDLDAGDRRLEPDVLLPFFGLSQNLGPIASWG